MGQILLVAIAIAIAVQTSAFGRAGFSAGSVQVFISLAILYFLTFMDLRAGMAAYVICIGVSPAFAIGLLNKLRLEDLLMPVLVLGWIGKSGKTRDKFESSPANVPIVCLFGVYLLTSTIGAVAGDVEPLYTAFRLGKFFQYYLIFWLFLNNIKTRSDFEAFVAVVLLVGLASSGLALLEAYRPDEGLATRTTGPEGETSNTWGGYLVINCAMLVGLFVGARTARMKAICAAGVLVSFWGVMMTLSRTSYVALFVGIVVFALVRRRAVFGWLLVLAVLFQIAMPDWVIDRAATILDVFGPNKPSSWTARVNGWASLSGSIYANPILGRGVGVIGLAQADNEYMLQLFQGGVLGLGLFLWMLWRLFRVGLATEEMTREDSLPGGFSTGFCLALLCLAVHGLGATSFTTIRTMEMFMVVAGICGALHNRYPKWKEEEERLIERRRTPAARGLARAGYGAAARVPR